MIQDDSQNNAATLNCRHCGGHNTFKPRELWPDPDSVSCVHCGESFFWPKHKAIPGLKPEHYQHPMDRAARRNLQQIPGLDTVLKVLMREGLVRYQQLLLKQNSVQVNTHHLNRYYHLMENGAAVFGLNKLPELYIEQSPQPNAYTFGADDHLIVVTTALLDLLTEQELESVLAHELAHVHCDHVLYKTAARILSTLAVDFAGRFFGLASSVIYPVIYGLLYWDRTSELSADRAELLVNHNPETSLSLLLKLAGGSQSSNPQLDIDAFRRQAQQVQELSENNWLLKAYLIIQEANSTHHFATWRAQQTDQWAQSSQALHLMAGQFDSATQDSTGDQQDPEQEPIGIGDIVAEFRRMFGLEPKQEEASTQQSESHNSDRENEGP